MDKNLEKLNQEVSTFNEEIEKFKGKGVKAAATRARKALQNIKTISGELRKQIIEEKNSN